MVRFTLAALDATSCVSRRRRAGRTIGSSSSITVAPGSEAAESLARMYAYGWDDDTDIGHAFGYVVAPDATASQYANDHGRFDVRGRLCGYSYATVDQDGRPIAVPAAELAQHFAIAPGGAPAGNIGVLNDDDPTGPTSRSAAATEMVWRRPIGPAGSSGRARATRLYVARPAASRDPAATSRMGRSTPGRPDRRRVTEANFGIQAAYSVRVSQLATDLLEHGTAEMGQHDPARGR